MQEQQNESSGIKDPTVVIAPVKLNVSKVAGVHGEDGMSVARTVNRKIVDPQIAQAHQQRMDADLSTRMQNQLQRDRNMAPGMKPPGSSPG